MSCSAVLRVKQPRALHFDVGRQRQGKLLLGQDAWVLALMPRIRFLQGQARGRMPHNSGKLTKWDGRMVVTAAELKTLALRAEILLATISRQRSLIRRVVNSSIIRNAKIAAMFKEVGLAKFQPQLRPHHRLLNHGGDFGDD